MTLPTDKTPARGALTPGLAALLDTTIERFDDDKRRAALGVPSKALSVSPDQLTLFDYNDAGDAVAWNGASL